MVISFSCQIVLANLLKDNQVQAGSSLNILTWQQMLGPEKAKSLFPVVHNIYSKKKEMRNGGYKFYDLHDGKMLYLLTQHLLFNRKHNPFFGAHAIVELAMTVAITNVK